MTTFTIPGYTATFGAGATATSFSSDTYEITVDGGISSFTYSFNGDDSGLLPGVDIDLNILSGQLGGTDILTMNNGAGPDAYFGRIVWIDGNTVKTSYGMVLYDGVTDTDYLFQVGGDVLPTFADVAEFNQFLGTQALLFGAAQPGSGFEAGDAIDVPFETWTSSGTGGIFGTTGDDILFGTADDDVITADAGDDRVEADTGNDEIYGGTGRDILYGQGGADEIYGDGGNDYLIGGGANDVVYGGNGVDRINGGSGADDLFGDIGNDKLYGNGGSDELDGGVGNDLLVGGGGNDSLIGGAGDDTLNGGRGRDTFIIDEGADTILGGSDKDLFIFNSDSDTGNVIKDYQDGVDKIFAEGYVAADVTIAASGADTIISTADWSATLEGIDVSLVTLDDFTFI